MTLLASLSLSASDLLLTVNGHNITKEDAQTFVAAAVPNANYEMLAPEEREMIKQRLVEKVLFSELAASEGVDKKSEYKQSMEKIRTELLVNLWMKMQLENVIVSNGDAKEFYDKNSDKYMQDAMREARHILLKEEKEAQEIIDILKPLEGKALHDKFIELAKSQSVGPSAANGGALGSFTKEQMVEPFSNATWAMQEGEVSQTPVKTRFGYHVILLEKITKAKPLAYSEVKENIVQTLKQQKFAQKISEVAKELKKNANIVDHTQEETKTIN